MGANIPDGTTLRYQSEDWDSTYFESPTDVLSRVSSRLAQLGIIVRSRDLKYGTIQVLYEVPGLSKTKFSVDMVVQVNNGLGFDKPDDVAAIINHAAYEETNYLPGSWSIPVIQRPGRSTETTGQPDLGKQHPGPEEKKGFLQTIEDYFSSLTSKATFALGFVALGIVAGIILVARAGKASS